MAKTASRIPWVDSQSIGLLNSGQTKCHAISNNPKLVVLLAFTITLACGAGVQAQQPAKIPRIGFASGSVDTAAQPDANSRIFRQQLRELGYIEGKNIAIEYRFSEGKGPEIEAKNARDLVQLNVDVLIATAYPAIRAAKEATKTIPIVMITTQDPVATGLIDSLARPGGNLTGVTHIARELSGKRLQLLLEIVPILSRVGFLMTKDSFAAANESKRYEDAARVLKVDHRVFPITIVTPDLPTAFDAAVKARVGAILAIRNAAMNRLSPRIAELAIKRRLPTMFEKSDAVDNGGLASYTADEPESFRRAAIYVDKILKGAKPADLAVEQPTKFEFIVSLKSAKQIGLTIPPNVLVRADRVIL